MPETTEDLQVAVDNIHNALIQCTTEIVESLAKYSYSYSAAAQWIEYANQLRLLVPDYATPAWLDQACSDFGLRYASEQGHYQMVATFTTKRAPEINHPILVGEAASLNVEDLFTTQSKRFDLNAVFEHLVSRLAELIAADVIDNRIVHESLTRLHALFRRSRNSSFATVLLSMNFGCFFLNSFGGFLRANRYAKPIVESFEKEFAEASKVVQKAEDAMKKEMIARLTNSARMQLFLEAHPDLKSTVSGFLPPSEDQDDDE